MPDESGFEIKDRFYPLPVSFRLGDPVLVEKVTDLDWPTFTERLPDEDSDPTAAEDIVVLTGLLAVSIWQEHPHWRRERVAKYVEQLDMETVKFIAADEPEQDDPDAPQEDEDGPPEDAAGEKSSETSPPQSNDTPASSSDQSNPNSSTTPTSDTTSPEPAPPAE